MKKYFTFLICTLLLVIARNTSAQNTTHLGCGLTNKLKELYKENPDLEADYARMLHNAKSYRIVKGEKQIVYTIPVVFHIIHEYGFENITDAQVYDQMEILNEDYRLRNADTNQIVPEFDTIKADIFIEFKLATKDPWGNCTNGIEHIYSHETFQGDDNSKLNQWHRSKYLNVWVVSSMEDGMAGYSFYPSSVDQSRFFADGVIMLSDYVGSIGTSSYYTSRTLTHEVGHWLGLSHPWGSNNDPGVACGDDQIEDTPETKGWDHCELVNNQICNPGIVENVQNYMDYAYCSYMFTEDQADMMRYNLTSTVANRSNLILDENHEETGIDVLSPPLCEPVADFYASRRLICQGQDVQFSDVSWRASVTSRTWTFEGGTPATSTEANPTVTYDTPGYKKVTLMVQNATGSNEVVQESYIYVSPLWADFTGPYSNNLDNGYENWFLVDNPENNFAKFQVVNNVGYNGSKCFKLNNYKNTAEALSYSNDWFYHGRLGGSKDRLISTSYDLSYTTNVSVSFKYAYATDGTILETIPDVVDADIIEEVKVYASKNCGETWTLKKTLSGAELLTSGFAGGSDFTPENNSQWKTCTFNYTATNQDMETRFKIEFIASDKSNNFYVDEFNVNGTLGLFINEADQLGIQVFPNPVNVEGVINVTYFAGDNPVEMILRDAQGKEIYSNTFHQTNALVNQTIDVNQSLSSSCYFLEVKTGGFSTIKKVVVF